MQSFPSLSSYLKEKGVTDVTPLEDIAALKRVYWKEYHRWYHQKRKKDEQRFTLRLTAKEYQRLSYYAKQHKQDRLGQFVKKAALAYLDQEYVPRNEAAVEELSRAVRKIGNNINQVVHSIHRTAKRQQLTGAFAEQKTLDYLQKEYEYLVKRVDTLQQEINGFMAMPPKRVGETLWEILTQEPDKIGQVRALLDKIEQHEQSVTTE